MPAPVRSHSKNLRVIYEDNHVIAVNKRPGDIVQGDKTGDLPLSEVVKSYIKVNYQKPGNVFLGVAHRIDRPTSGVVVFARTSKALKRLNASFAGKTAEKTYWAVVEGKPEENTGVLTHWLRKNPAQNKSYPVKTAAAGAKEAVLEYRVREVLHHYSWLEVRLETGRHHQIRAQLAAIGHPVKGDVKYGARRSNKDQSIHLHARKLVIPHPVNQPPLELIAPPPDDPLWQACS